MVAQTESQDQAFHKSRNFLFLQAQSFCQRLLTYIEPCLLPNYLYQGQQYNEVI